MTDQIAQAELAGGGNLDHLLHGSSTWTVPASRSE
jgi:hypothetical protein